MLTEKDFEEMTEDEMKQCTFMQIIAMYLYGCRLDESEITTFFETLEEEYFDKLQQPVGDAAGLLFTYRREVFAKAKDWAEMHYPDSVVSRIIATVLQHQFATDIQ